MAVAAITAAVAVFLRKAFTLLSLSWSCWGISARPLPLLVLCGHTQRSGRPVTCLRGSDTGCEEAAAALRPHPSREVFLRATQVPVLDDGIIDFFIVPYLVAHGAQPPSAFPRVWHEQTN